MYVLAPRLHAHGRPGGCVRPWAKTSPSASCVAVAVADRPAGTSNCVSIDECTTNRKPACCRPAAGPLGDAGSSARHGTAPQSAGAARNVSALLCWMGSDVDCSNVSTKANLSPVSSPPLPASPTQEQDGCPFPFRHKRYSLHTKIYFFIDNIIYFFIDNRVFYQSKNHIIYIIVHALYQVAGSVHRLFRCYNKNGPNIVCKTIDQTFKTR
jgi:hypothetical protein